MRNDALLQDITRNAPLHWFSALHLTFSHKAELTQRLPNSRTQASLIFFFISSIFRLMFGRLLKGLNGLHCLFCLHIKCVTPTIHVMNLMYVMYLMQRLDNHRGEVLADDLLLLGL